MALIIPPFASPLGSDGGPGNDGVARGILSRVQPVATFSTAASGANSLILHGDTSGAAVQWSEITTASNDFTDDDVPVFNGNDDLYFIELVPSDVIESIDWFVSTAGVYTHAGGNVDIWYYDASGGMVAQNNILIPDFTSTGIKRLMLPAPIDVANVGATPDPRGLQSTHKAIYLRFQGITGVTTPPLAQRMWKRRTAGAPKIVTDYTPLINDPDKTPYLGLTVMPLAGDVSLIGYSAPWAKEFVNIVRSREVSWQTEPVYSTGPGAVGFNAVALSTLGLSASYLQSAGTGDELWTEAPGDYMDAFEPPSNWAKGALTVGASTQDLFWRGWRYTADASAPALTLLASLDLQPFQLTGSNGVRSAETAVYTVLELWAESPATHDSTFVVANINTGRSAKVNLPAGATQATAAVAFAVSVNHLVVAQQIQGVGAGVVADVALRLS